MDILTTLIPQTSGPSASKAFWRRRTSGSLPQTLEMPLPTGYALTDTLGSWCQYRGRLYGVGIGTDNGMVDENFRFVRQGIAPPNQVPYLTAGAGPGRTGRCVVYVAFYDSFTDEFSPLSGASNEVTLSNATAVTGNIQTTAEARVTHVAIFVSMDGSTPRLATKRQLGITTVTEGVAWLALGAAFPTTFTRLPRASMNTFYHERQIVAGVFGQEDKVFVSGISHPERYEGLSFQTRNGEHVTALITVYNDVCLVMTNRNAYALRGYRDADMTMTILDPDVGCINHRCWDYAHGRPIVVNQQGFWIYNGAFHNISRDRAQEWTDFYKANRAVVEKSFAVVDENEYTYSLIFSSTSLVVPEEIPNPSGVLISTVMWVADYSTCTPEVSGSLGQPTWYIDAMNRGIDSAARLTLPGTKRSDVFFGSCDGYFRGKDDTNADDDGDSYGKLWWVRTKADDMGDPGGGPADGKTLSEFWTYMNAETAWKLYAHGGDEWAWWTGISLGSFYPDNVDRFWRDNVAASADAQASDGFTYPGIAVHYHKPQKVTGRLFTFDFSASTPLGMRWRGFGGIYGPGRTTRGPIGQEISK